MFYIWDNKENLYVYSSNVMLPVINFVMEYEEESNKIIMFNTGFDEFYNIKKCEDIKNKKLVYYNFEHKYPIDPNGQMKFCSKNWTDNFNKILEQYDEIWDFQIENYEYFVYHKLSSKFKFYPMRYTKWFEQYVKKINPNYDLQFECVVDTNTRKYMLNVLTNEPCRKLENGDYETRERISIKMTNTFNTALKLNEKNDCRYGFDFPHYDSPCTINNVRIYEYLCMNKPVIVWDRDKITSRKYFNDLCVWIDDFTTWNIKQETIKTPKNNISEIFKKMTSNKNDYNFYVYEIVKDYKETKGITIPDTSLIIC